MSEQLKEIRRLHGVCRGYKEEIEQKRGLLKKALELLSMSQEELRKL